MASGREVRMESSKVDLILQMMVVVLSLLQEARNDEQNTIKPKPSGRSHRIPDENSNPQNEQDTSSGVVVPIGPILRSPIDPTKEYDLRFATQYLGVSEQTVRKRIKNHLIEAVLRKGNGRGIWKISGEELIKHSNPNGGE